MRRASLAALTLAGAAGIHAASAQDAGEDVRTLSATISQSVAADSNYNLDDDSPGTSYLADTRLDIGFLRDTATQTLDFGLNTGLRALWEAEQPFELTLASPTGARLGFAQEWANSNFDARLRYRQRRTDFTEDIGDFIADEGALPDNLQNTRSDTRELRFDADIAFEYGTSAPSTYGLRYVGTAIDYSDSAASLTPRRSNTIEGTWELEFTPVFSSIVAGSYFYYDADNAPDTQLQVAEIDAGIVYQPDPNVRVRGGIGYANRQKEETIGGTRQTTDDNSGATLRGDFFYRQEDYNFAGDGRLTTAAPQTRFSFAVTGNYQLARGNINGRIFNRYTVKDDGITEVRVAGASIGLVRDINTVSRFGLDFAVANETNLDVEDAPDTTNTQVTAVYSYDLTRVVTADLGYRFRSEIEDPSNANSNRVFFRIGRTFSTGL
jgi:hypothetical protein